MSSGSSLFASWLGSAHAQTRLLGIIAVVLSLGALRLSQPVVAPLVMALFLIIVLWPVHGRLEQSMPRVLATLLSLLIVLLAMVAFATLVGWSLQQIADRGPQLERRFAELSSSIGGWLRGIGLPVPAWLRGDASLGERLSGYAPAAVRWMYETAFSLALVLVYTALGLYEVREFEQKIRRRFDQERSAEMREIAVRIAGKVRRFLLGVILSGTVNAVAMIAFAVIVGLDLPLLWAAIAFLLNFVMGIGPIVAVAPPVLYALLQFDGLQRPLIVLLGVGTIQFLVNNVVEPKIEGRVVSLSPVLVLFTVLLWGWLWGGFGALLAVPIMVALVIVSAHFESTRWFAALVADANDGALPEEKGR
jgi:predicted PurR-regulated permease PerM